MGTYFGLSFQQKANQKKSTKIREEESLDEAEFVAFYYSLLKRPELDEVFIRYLGYFLYLKLFN